MASEQNTKGLPIPRPGSQSQRFIVCFHQHDSSMAQAKVQSLARFQKFLK
jgi:hypothetical protein